MNNSEKGMKFTTKEVADYVCGWLLADEEFHSAEDVNSAVSNAKTCLKCPHDGIEAVIKRQRLRLTNNQNQVY